MSRKQVFYVLPGVLAVAGIYVFFNLGYYRKLVGPDDQLEIRTSEAALGGYESTLEKVAGLEEENLLPHYTLKIWGEEGETPLEDLKKVVARNELVLFTIEMWNPPGEEGSYQEVLQNVVEGHYDTKIKDIASQLAANRQKVFVRWNPDMEMPENRYPWQNRAPGLYIEAFHRVAKQFKKIAPNTFIVWGPAGFSGASEYWPGSDVVDFVSITLGHSPGKNNASYPAENPFSAEVGRKLHRLRFMDKPFLLLATEKVAKEIAATHLLEDALEDHRKYREVLAAAAERKPVREERLEPALAGNEEEGERRLKIGVYDPEQKLSSLGTVSVEHLFVNLANIEEGPFREGFRDVLSRGNEVIVTVEPHPHKGKEDGQNVLLSTLHGEYDKEIQILYDLLCQTEQTVYLRFAHEMEIPIERYPWQSQDPSLYIRAFRYFATFQKPLPSHIQLVWGPAGDRGSLEWWPGADVVDYISIAIYGLPDKNISKHEEQEAFSTIFRRKLHRLRLVDKPVFITEFGVKGPDSFQQKWLQEAAKTLNNYPDKLAGICYFNLHDSPNAWGEIKAPDWSVSKESFQQFVESLARN